MFNLFYIFFFLIEGLENFVEKWLFVYIIDVLISKEIYIYENYLIFKWNNCFKFIGCFYDMIVYYKLNFFSLNCLIVFLREKFFWSDKYNYFFRFIIFVLKYIILMVLKFNMC